MKNNLQALREYQSRVDLSELEKSIYISIDRLTVILDRENCSLRRIFWELRNSIDSIIQEFSIQANLREDYFTLYKMINEDSINLIFFQLSTYGGYQVINEFLTTFFKFYPTATVKELSYYVNDGILKPIRKDYVFQELVNPIYNRKDNQVTVSLAVKYLDQQTKATQVSQFDLVLEKVGNNWKIIK